MVFKYKWSDKENGNFAIRKRSAKGIEAGKKIEPKKNQTSDTHFFILVDKNDIESMSNIFRINKILETIKYDYRQRGTNKKSGTPYLTKKNIEDVLNNIDKYKNQTIKIETAFSKALQQEKKKLINKSFKEFKEIIQIGYGYKEYITLMKMIKTSINKKQELKEKQLETKKRIKELQNDLLKTETTNNAEIEKIEKAIYTFLKSKHKDLQYTGGKVGSNFQKILELSYIMVKNEIHNKKASDIQKRYRDRKNIESGNPKRNRGRPPKTEK